MRIECVEEDPGVPTAYWRSVGSSQNAFTIGCFIDKLAYAAKTDPVAFRLNLLSPSPRHRGVLELAPLTAPLKGRRYGCSPKNSAKSVPKRISAPAIKYLSSEKRKMARMTGQLIKVQSFEARVNVRIEVYDALDRSGKVRSGLAFCSPAGFERAGKSFDNVSGGRTRDATTDEVIEKRDRKSVV